MLPKLKLLDQVAFIRFASIYRDFRDVEGFAKEVNALRSEDTGESLPPLPDETTDEHALIPAAE